MNLEIIATGDEVITGFITDTNSAWLCQQLLNIGIQVKRRQTVGDKLEDIVDIISERSKSADIILINGGLGPTTDDNTTEAAAIAANVEMEKYEAWVNKLHQIFEKIGKPMPESNIKQAILPKGSEIIENQIGTACGFKLKINKAICYFTPGVPKEFKLMVENKILPELKKLANVNIDETKVFRYFTFGISESKIGEEIKNNIWPNTVTIGYRAVSPTIEIKLICRNASEEDIKKSEVKLIKIIEKYQIPQNLPEKISELLNGKKLLILDYGTKGRIIEKCATAIPGVIAKYEKIPSNADELLEYLHKDKNNDFQLTLAIGSETSEGYSIACKFEKKGFVQTLKTYYKDQEKSQQVMVYAGLDMLYRILSHKTAFANYDQYIRTCEISMQKV